MLGSVGWTGLTELNGFALSPKRRAGLQSELTQIARRKATARLDLRELLLGVREWGEVLEAVRGRVSIETVG